MFSELLSGQINAHRPQVPQGSIFIDFATLRFAIGNSMISRNVKNQVKWSNKAPLDHQGAIYWAQSMIWGPFLEAKTTKTDWKMLLKNIFFFWCRIFRMFFWDFGDFGSILGDSGDSKNLKNHQNVLSGRIWDFHMILGGCLYKNTFPIIFFQNLKKKIFYAWQKNI